MKEKTKKQEEKEDLLNYIWNNNEFFLLSNRIGIVRAFEYYYNRYPKFTELANRYLVETIYRLCNERLGIINTK